MSQDEVFQVCLNVQHDFHMVLEKPCVSYASNKYGKMTTVRVHVFLVLRTRYMDVGRGKTKPLPLRVSLSHRGGHVAFHTMK